MIMILRKKSNIFIILEIIIVNFQHRSAITGGIFKHMIQGIQLYILLDPSQCLLYWVMFSISDWEGILY